MKIFTPFLLAFIGTHFAVFATLHSLDEWKETCRTIINEIEDTETNLAAESNEKIKLQLNSLASEVGKMNFLCLAPNDEKPNCKFDKSNSHFLYSLTEAIRYCEDQNVGQPSAGNSQKANLSILKMFVQQFRADFNTLIMEIELLEIEESARCEEMNKENVQKFFAKLEDIQEEIKENKGFYDEEMNRYMKSSMSNDQGFCYGDAVEKAKKELAESLEKNEHNNDSDDNVHQILIKMIVKMKCLIYENELNGKTAFLMDEHVNGKGIIAMSKIFRQKFEQIRQLMGDDKGQDDDAKINREIVLDLATKTAGKSSAMFRYKNMMKNKVRAFIEKANKSLPTLQEEFVKISAVRMKKFVNNVQKLRNQLRPEFLSVLENEEDMPELTTTFIENELKNAITKFLKQMIGIEQLETMEKEIPKAFRIRREDTSLIKKPENMASSAENV